MAMSMTKAMVDSGVPGALKHGVTTITASPPQKAISPNK
jgi:hypothetical protein